MELSLTFKVLSALILISFKPQHAEAVPINNQSFEQWCLQKKSLPTETKKTVEVLLKKAGTQNCKLADSRLKSSTILIMAFDQTSDLKPLASLTNLLELERH